MACPINVLRLSVAFKQWQITRRKMVLFTKNIFIVQMATSTAYYAVLYALCECTIKL